MVQPRIKHTVTGAFGYSGSYIARHLLAQGLQVSTLTNSPQRQHPLQGKVSAEFFHFEDPARLEESLQGTTVLYNTYWVRFNHRCFSHADAVANTKALFAAARRAGVERVVHVSITNPSLDSHLEYFRGKAVLEQALVDSGLSYAILRPTVLFGKEDILINNIAWCFRRLPVFGVFGSGEYRLQPIHVDDLAQLAVAQGQMRENVTINAIGPETFTYRELARVIGEIIGKPRRIISVSPFVGQWAGTVLGKLVGDVIVTREEIDGLMSDLLCVDTPPTGGIALTEWARRHADNLGQRYTSELARRRDRVAAYASN